MSDRSLICCYPVCLAIGTVAIFCAEIILKTPTGDLSIQGKPKPFEGE